MKSIILPLVVVLSMIVGYNSYAQQLKNTPKEFQRPVESVLNHLVSSSLSAQMANQPWFVFSDRSLNILYSDPDLKTKGKTLKFGQKMGVLELTNDVLKVGIIDKDKKIGDIGYISINKILLWKKSLVDDSNRVDIRAMVMYTIGKGSLQDEGRVRIYMNPIVSNNAADYTFHDGIFDYFFIFKTEGNFYLIGKRNYIDNVADNVLYGWVHKENVSTWSHRVAWEKNWEVQAVAERQSFTDNTGIIVTNDRSEANCLLQLNRRSQSSKGCIKTNSVYLETRKDMSTVRHSGTRGRFPLLEMGSRNVAQTTMKVGVISSIEIPGLSKVEDDLVTKILDDMGQIRKINIIFVIDATQSMQPYSASIQSGVNNAMKQIADSISKRSNRDDKQNDYSFGAVLYRDDAMARPVEKWGQNLSSDKDALFKWLNDRMNNVNNNPAPGKKADPDQAEAVFNGLYFALDQYRIDPSNSNYVILIGDCGDHFDKTRSNVYKTLESVMPLYQKYNVNFMAFQVHNEGKKEHRDFVDTLRRFSSDILGISSLLPGSPSNPLLYKEPAIAKIKTRIKSCPLNKPLSVQDLTFEIKTNITFIEDDVNKKVRELTEIFEGKGVSDPVATARVVEFLKRKGVPPSEAKEWCERGLTQEYSEGYTVLNNPDCQYPLFKQVVLLEKADLHGINVMIGDLIKAKVFPPTEKTKYLINTFRSMARTYFPGIPDKEIQFMDIGNLLYRITGKPCTNNEICSIQIDKIGTYPKAKLDSIITYFEQFKKGLLTIESSLTKYPARYSPPDTKLNFIYIPAEDIP